MIKRVSKAKKSKQGAILVIVVLILALAMIFIASAMMLTQATRNRTYDDAISSQARLTVTAASEVFLEALEKQEITDVQIDNMLSQKQARSTDNSTKIKMVINDVPGMSEEADNCTYLDMYYPDTSDHKIVNCDFTTTIGDSVESVRIVLKANDSQPDYGGRFMNQIDIEGDVGTSNLRFTDGVGMVNPALGDVTDNTILLRNSVHEQTSSAVFFSDLVFVNGDVKVGGGNVYNGNMIFLEDATMGSRSSAGTFGGDFYFVGNNGSAGFKVSDGMVGVFDNLKDSSCKYVFSGRTVQNDTVDQNHKVQDALNNKTCYFVGVTGGVSATYWMGNTYTVDNAGSTLPSDMNTRLQLYKNYNYTSASGAFPTDVESQVFAQYKDNSGTNDYPANYVCTRTEYTVDGHVYHKGETIPEASTCIANPIAKTYDGCGKTDDYKTDHTYSESALFDKAKANPSFEPGFYYITAGTTTSTAGIPAVVAINGASASGYRFYFASGDHYINDLVFAVYNVAAANPPPVFFILEPGAKLHFSGANYRQTNYLCTAGFISISRNKTSASGIASYIQGTALSSEEIVWSTEHKKQDNSQIKYSKFYDGIQKPCIYVIGTGSNQFDIGDCMTIEAYVGLYGNSTLDLVSGLNSKVPIYGRIEANNYGTIDNPTGQFCMPYCPAPGQVNNQPNERRAETKYKVVNIIYYYGEGSVPAST